MHWDGRQFCFGLGKFVDVRALLDHFEQQPLISGDSGGHLSGDTGGRREGEEGEEGLLKHWGGGVHT